MAIENWKVEKLYFYCKCPPICNFGNLIHSSELYCSWFICKWPIFESNLLIQIAAETLQTYTVGVSCVPVNQSHNAAHEFTCIQKLNGLWLLLKEQLTLVILIFFIFFMESLSEGCHVGLLCVCLQRSLMYTHRKSKRRDENSWGTGSFGRFRCYLEVSSFLSLLLIILFISHTHTFTDETVQWVYWKNVLKTYSRFKAYPRVPMNMTYVMFTFRTHNLRLFSGLRTYIK